MDKWTWRRRNAPSSIEYMDDIQQAPLGWDNPTAVFEDEAIRETRDILDRLAHGEVQARSATQTPRRFPLCEELSAFEEEALLAQSNHATRMWAYRMLYPSRKSKRKFRKAVTNA